MSSPCPKTIQWVGGLDGRQATVTLAYARTHLKQVEHRLAEEYPSREVLAAVYKAVRDLGAQAAWPDEALGRALDSATQLDPRRQGAVPSTKGTLV